MSFPVSTSYLRTNSSLPSRSRSGKPTRRQIRANPTRFAYQAIAGVSYALTERVSLGIEYRYFATTDPSYSDNPGGGGTSRVDAEYKTHNVLVNLIYRFD